MNESQMRISWRRQGERYDTERERKEGECRRIGQMVAAVEVVDQVQW